MTADVGSLVGNDKKCLSVLFSLFVSLLVLPKFLRLFGDGGRHRKWGTRRTHFHKKDEALVSGLRCDKKRQLPG